MLNTPVLLIIFNRPDATKKVFESIRNVKPTRLYIAADAPRSSHRTDLHKCMQARAITENIDWLCDVKRLYRNTNLGCGLAVSGAINWFFSFETQGIILEDDCLPHSHFFHFASVMLDKFRDNPLIISVNGSNLGYMPVKKESYFFSRYMNMWGWATWRDRAMGIDYEMKKWKFTKNQNLWLYQKMKQYLFDFDVNWYRLWKSKFDLVSKDINFTWDWQWIHYQISNSKLSVVPSANLVSNIGFDFDGTHTHAKDNPAANIPVQAIAQPYLHPTIIKPDIVYEEQFIKWVWCYHKRLSIFFYLKQYMSRLLGRNV